MSDEPMSPAPEPRPSSDPVVTWLWVGVFAVVVLILTLLVYILVAGVLNPPAPRTQAERQIFMLEQVVQEKPESAQAWADFADAYTSTGQYSKAQEVIDRAIAQLGEGVPEIELSKGKLLLAQGDTEAALAQLETALSVTLDFRTEELTRMLQTGVTPPETTIKSDVVAETSLLIATIHRDAGEWQLTIDALDMTLNESPGNADALVMRGHAHAELGDSDAARADFEKALTFIPDYQPALEGLEMLEEGAGQ